MAQLTQSSRHLTRKFTHITIAAEQSTEQHNPWIPPVVIAIVVLTNLDLGLFCGGGFIHNII